MAAIKKLFLKKELRTKKTFSKWLKKLVIIKRFKIQPKYQQYVFNCFYVPFWPDNWWLWMLTHSLQKTELHKQNNKLELPKWFSQQLESEHETIFLAWSLHHKRVKKLQNLLTKIIPIESKSFKAFQFFVGEFLVLWKIKLWFLLFWNSKWFN